MSQHGHSMTRKAMEVDTRSSAAGPGLRARPASGCPAAPPDQPALTRASAAAAGSCRVRWRRRTAILILSVLAALLTCGCSGGLIILTSMPDKHGDTRDRATHLPDGSELTGYLTEGDVDYFRITVEELSYLYVETDGSTDTAGALLDEWGRIFAKDDHSGVAQNFAFGHRVSPGEYYLRVEGTGFQAVGAYTVRARIETVDEHGAARATATYVPIGGSAYGFMRRGDTDYFKFVVDQDVDQDFARITVYSEGITDTVAFLENRYGRLLDIDDDSGPGRNFGFAARVRAGTYYVRVEGYRLATAGRYRLFIIR